MVETLYLTGVLTGASSENHKCVRTQKNDNESIGCAKLPQITKNRSLCESKGHGLCE